MTKHSMGDVKDRDIIRMYRDSQLVILRLSGKRKLPGTVLDAKEHREYINAKKTRARALTEMNIRGMKHD